MKYAEILNIASNFRRSTNILYDTNCDTYILSTSSIEALRRIFIQNTSNSIAITGPFGSGKSSFLLFLEALLAKKTEHSVCIQKLEDKESNIFEQYEKIVGNKDKGFFTIKLVGEHLSFKQIFLTTLQSKKELKVTNKFIKTNQDTSLPMLLDVFHDEVMKLGYTGAAIFIDELGKIIEYASEKYLDSDIHALQDLAEFVNKQENYRLVVALHKSFKDYVQNTSQISFTEWDKIQGRFENIVFQDDFYELMHIFEEAITVTDHNAMKNVQSHVRDLFSRYKKHLVGKHIPVNETSLQKLAPLHPFTSLALFHIFSKHFQNQRSVFSFLSAYEPYSFQSFVADEYSEQPLYTLPMLFDYINYLLNAYNVNMVDKESWKLANEYLDSTNILTDTQQKIIKSVALISAFKLEHLVQLDEYALELALPSEKDIKGAIQELENKGLLLYKISTNTFALIEETSIDINADLAIILKGQIKTDFEAEINKLITNDKVLAKRFFINTGTAKFFTKEFIEADLSKSANTPFKLIYVSADVPDKELISISKKNPFSVYIALPMTRHLKSIVEQSIGIEKMLKRKDVQANKLVRKILSNMLNGNKIEIDKILDIKEQMYFSGNSLPFSSEQLQQSISTILETTYPDMPIIINDLVNTVNYENSVPSGMKMLFKHMIEHESEANLGIDKTPPEKAIYLSVLKRSGLHTLSIKNRSCKFSTPDQCNFTPSWQELTNLMKKGQVLTVETLIDALRQKPFGLNEDAAKFFVFLFLIVNESHIHFFRENTYQFDFDVDQVMDIWKNTKLYTIRWYELTDDEKIIFAKYIQIFDQYFDTSYTKQNIKFVFQKLFTKLKALPTYCHQTQKLSENAISLRSGILSSKEPHTSFFKVFPHALGYDALTITNANEFINTFKIAFNEIVFSYKAMILDLEQSVAVSFDLTNKHYPFGNELERILEKYLREHEDKDANDIYRMCTTANDLVAFLNGLSLVLNHKKVDDAFDKDIQDIKRNIKVFAQHVLAKLDIIELINERPIDVKKLKVSTLHGESDLVVSVENNKIPELSGIAEKVLYNLPNYLTKDEKLYLIALLAEEATKGNNE
ncbi:MAG: hypothetical protein RBR63_04565 [Methanosarcina vacuolata]|jgi:energy-coupling factor transporter ATP-binding protein EcfA2|nr:hypothetical protein [Methanosarcina vacuolata]